MQKSSSDVHNSHVYAERLTRNQTCLMEATRLYDFFLIFTRYSLCEVCELVATFDAKHFGYNTLGLQLCYV